MSKIPNLYGLVLTGGISQRMQKDKAALDFHGKPQGVFCYDLLDQLCEKVFVSNRREQKEEEFHKNYPQIHDKEDFAGCGPLTGILSAMTTYPQADWLVLACDLPFVTTETIQYLLNHRNLKNLATAFVSTHDGLPEPLCAIYESHALTPMLGCAKDGFRCPRKFLMKVNTALIDQKNPRWLDNVNTPEEFEQAKELLKKMGDV